MSNYLIVGLLLLAVSIIFIYKGLNESGFKLTKILPPFMEWSREPQDDKKEEALSIEDKHRRLEPLETGKSIEQLPDNVYGFEGALEIAFFINKPGAIPLKLSNRNYDEFEIQKTEGINYLIGFVSEESYSKIGEASKSNPVELILFPRSWKNTNRLVAIPFNSISEINHRRVDVEENKSLTILELKASELKTDAISHVKS